MKQRIEDGMAHFNAWSSDKRRLSKIMKMWLENLMKNSYSLELYQYGTLSPPQLDKLNLFQDSSQMWKHGSKNRGNLTQDGWMSSGLIPGLNWHLIELY